MSLKLYDDALLNKFQKWTQGTQTTLTGVNQTSRLFSKVIDEKKDKELTLPLIALSRPGGFQIEDKYKQPKSYNGLTFAQNAQQGAKVNIIRISIPYQIDVYTRYQEEADEYIRNIVFNIINYPKVQVQLPYEKLESVHDSNIRLASEVEDNSDIPERLAPGQFTRYTLQINIDDAYLFDVRLKDNLSISEITVGTQSNDQIDKEVVE